MGFLFGLFPGLVPYRLLIELAMVAALAAAVGFYIHHIREEGVVQGRAEIQQKWDAEKRVQLAAAVAEGEANAKETKRRLTAQQEAQHAHDEEDARIRADADRARVAAGSLRKQLAEFAAAARRAASDPKSVANSAPAGDPIGVLAELFSSADDRAGILAQALDASHAAGLQCVREYDALTSPRAASP
jgi:hypothetical protein